MRIRVEFLIDLREKVLDRRSSDLEELNFVEGDSDEIDLRKFEEEDLRSVINLSTKSGFVSEDLSSFFLSGKFRKVLILVNSGENSKIFFLIF